LPARHACIAHLQGLDEEGVDALLTLLRQEQQVHPAHLGGSGSASQQLRQSTPPAHLSVAATQAIRQASVKLFQELGLRDYAQFSGWVLQQQQQAEGSSSGAAAAQQAEQQQQEDDEEEEEEEEEQQPKGRSFAELLELDAAARAEAAAAAAAALGGSGILASDRAGALDTSSAAASGAPADAADGPSSSSGGGGNASGSTSLEVAAPSGGTYGTYNGLVLDDGVRPNSEDALEFMAGLNRPIPEGPPPEPLVEALEDLSDADPRALCHLSASGQVVAFAQLRCVSRRRCCYWRLCR
jgi:hypothetical protein